MKPALEAAVGAGTALVFAYDMSAVAAMRGAAQGSELILLVIEPGVSALDRAMLIAALGPLAQDLAPTVRFAALDLAEGAVEADIVAAAAYLAAARSTTGQVLRIAARG